MSGVPRRVRRFVGVGLALAVGGIGIAGVVSAHGGDTAKIHSCVKNGNVRIVDANELCKETETALDWNAQGAPGPAGLAGPAGPTGPQGPPGPTEAAISRATSSGIGGSEPFEVAAVVVRPGRWVLQAKAFVGTLNARAAGTCTLHTDSTTFVIEGVFPGQTVALLDIGEFGTETRIPLMCSTFPASEATLQVLDGVVVATRVGDGTV